MAEYIYHSTVPVNTGEEIEIKYHFNAEDYPLVCPEEGEFIGYKIGYSNDCNYEPCIITLLIPADAKRSSAFGNKCRCNKAKVLEIKDFDGYKKNSAISTYDLCFLYKVDEEVSVYDFDENRWHECAPGIHFFMTMKEAINYWG